MKVFRLFDNVSEWGGDWYVVIADNLGQARDMVRKHLCETAVAGRTIEGPVTKEEHAAQRVAEFDTRVQGFEEQELREGVIYEGNDAE